MKNKRKYIGQRKAKKDSKSDEPETDERDQIKHLNLNKMLDSQKIGDDDYSVPNDIYMESNVTKNT